LAVQIDFAVIAYKSRMVAIQPEKYAESWILI
jgi:hypothetical protein